MMSRTESEARGNDHDPALIYHQLQEACKQLEAMDNHAIAAVVSHAMAMLEEKYGVGSDHLGREGNIH